SLHPDAGQPALHGFHSRRPRTADRALRAFPGCASRRCCHRAYRPARRPGVTTVPGDAAAPGDPGSTLTRYFKLGRFRPGETCTFARPSRVVPAADEGCFSAPRPTLFRPGIIQDEQNARAAGVPAQT